MASFLFSGGSVDITPNKKVPLAGFGGREEPFTSIGEPLEADAIFLSYGTAKVVFVTVDLLYIGEELRAGVLQRLKGALTENELFISSSHSHFAPATDSSKPLLGKTDNEYLESVVTKISQLVESLLSENPRPVTISYSFGKDLASSINRRRFVRTRTSILKKKMSGNPNPKGYRDPTVRIIKLCDKVGKTVAIAWNYSCHPTAYHDPTCVSSDYPGAIRAILRAKSSENVPIIFWQGFSGDVNPPAIKKHPMVLSRSFFWHIASRILNGGNFGPFTSSEWRRWVDRLGESAVGVLMDENRLKIEDGIDLKRVTIPLRVLGFESDDELVFHEVKLGKLKIIGISAEPVAEYVPILEKIFKGAPFIPVGYIDKTTLYLPTNKMLSEGGYETEDFAKWFGISGKFIPNLQDEVEQVIRSL